MTDILVHYGILRRSGRYPWGSGGTVLSRSRSFLGTVEELRGKGLSETEIATGLGMTTTQLREAKTIAKNAKKQSDIGQAQRLKDKGLSNVAIGERMNINESSVRALLAPGQKDKADVLHTTANMLKEQVDTKGFIDVGSGVENQIGLARTRLDAAISVLKGHGYQVHTVQVDQLGTKNKTLTKVLAPPGTKYRDIAANKDKIRQIHEFSEDGGRSFLGIRPPINIDSKRIDIRYAEQGGDKADGVIYVRRGVDDIALGSSSYAQVRIAVDGTHYLKGMAVYKDDLPKGVDLQFNTNKSNTGNKLDAMKKMKDDPDDPFGSVIKQIIHKDENGKEHVASAMNIVYEQGDWDTWSRNLSSQFLSKQSPLLAKTQLDMTFERKKAQLDEILSLTNPAVRKKLLQSFSDGADSSAEHLKAAQLPRQQNRVILPMSSLKETEVYAPGFRNGERVVLVRHPHGGPFEIPELTVNNRHPEARKIINEVPDAIAIHHNVAKRLSGADFDGDTVLVIPNNANKIKTAPPLEKLKDFDPQRAYPGYDGMKKMDARTKGFEMGDISNLITDMTIKGANNEELSQAVRHSMVVIDAEKHGLNWKQSALDHRIPSLKEKYQSKPGEKGRGASTLISRAGSRKDVLERKPRSAKDGGPIDRATGKKMFTETGDSFERNGKTIFKKTTTTKLADTENAHTLSSGTKIETIYADHSNRLKDLANQARKEMVNTKGIPYSPSAKLAYSHEVGTLSAKLNVALKNAPRERQAQILANTTVSAKRAANPEMDAAELKKLKGKALTEARIRTGAGKERIQITDGEWAAIQAGAISNHKLEQILNNADLDRVKELATPRVRLVMTSTKTRRAQQMLASGYTQAEVADQLGVSLTTLKNTLKGE